MDPQYARRIGVNIDDLLVSQPDTGEQALEIVELLTRSTALTRSSACSSTAATVTSAFDSRWATESRRALASSPVAAASR
jgi:RecA/RadA recombinase